MSRSTALSHRLAFLSLLVACAASACGPAPAPAAPEGTVLRLDGVPVTAEQVDRVAQELFQLHPVHTLQQRRRSALVEVILPGMYARELDESGRAKALERARDFHAEALSAEDESDLPPTAETPWSSMGIDIWLAVHELELGVWSEPLEVPGGFVVARMIERSGAAKAANEGYLMNLEIFPWVPERGQLSWDMRAAELEIVDPTWEDVIPARWRYAMTGDQR